mgnify:CR=1 FL=1|tara:strand:+ start:3648 stop:4514 length:867 start_codon:yes stop_codon:yes gene_type:complete
MNFNIFKNESLSKYNWFNLGGPAEFFFKPTSEEELRAFLLQNTKKINIIGAGSNLLIRDGGLKGVTIKLGSKFSQIKLLKNNIIEAGSSTLDRKISDFALTNSLSSMEFLSCIPGSIGGGVKMNSGCYNEDISQIFVSLDGIDDKGKLITISNDELKFKYRGCNLSENLIILRVRLQGTSSKKELIQQKQLRLLEKKKESQPSKIKTCGSTFKNPNQKKAWQLIKESNSHQLSFGDAQISKKHCNFFINNGNATSFEIEELIKKVKKKVFEKTGVNLELEIKVIGIQN